MIYRAPQDGVRYAAGIDVAEETPNGDYSCAHFLRCDTLEQVAVWHGRMPPRRFGHQMYQLGLFYNAANLCPEFTGPGGVTCRALYDELGYPNLYWREPLDRFSAAPGSIPRPGFVTSSKTKKFVLDSLLQAIYDDAIVLHDKETIAELAAFEHNYSKYGIDAYSAPSGGHDDHVMALALALEAVRQFRQPQQAETGQQFVQKLASAGIIRLRPKQDDAGTKMLNWCHR